MKARTLSTIIYLIIFIPLIIIGGTPLRVFISLLGIFAVGELLYMKKRLLISLEAIFSFLAVIFFISPNLILYPINKFFSLYNFNYNDFLYIYIILILIKMVLSNNELNFNDAGSIILGVFYIGFGFHYFLQDRANNWMLFVFGLIIVWSTDSFAYIFGKKFGKHHLIPKISPNKTWEGAIGGSLSATLIASVYAFIFKVIPQGLFLIILIALLLSIFDQIGDLIESALKRSYRVKDSGKILPGHGGIFDRFDSMLLLMPLLAGIEVLI